MRDDEELRNEVVDVLMSEPSTHDTQVIATATNGVVTLKGKVDSYKKIKMVEALTKSVSGVESIDDQLELDPEKFKGDADAVIVRQILKSFESNWAIPTGRITLRLDHGYLTLGGDVDFEFEKLVAEIEATNISGIRNISNRITVGALRNSGNSHVTNIDAFYF